MTNDRTTTARRLIAGGLVALTLAPIHARTGLRASQTATQEKEKPGARTTARPGDVESVEAILAALYDSISGPAGTRDWNRLRSLFLPGARLIPCRRGADMKSTARVLTVEEFIAAVAPRVRDEGFFESEIHRRVERFGAIAHVFSTYESRRAKQDARPFVRGINSIQLFFDSTRWWVVTIFWDSERPDQPIPKEYVLKKGPPRVRPASRRARSRPSLFAAAGETPAPKIHSRTEQPARANVIPRGGGTRRGLSPPTRRQRCFPPYQSTRRGDGRTCRPASGRAGCGS